MCPLATEEAPGEKCDRQPLLRPQYLSKPQIVVARMLSRSNGFPRLIFRRKES